MTSALSGFRVFGKLPSQADFVQLGSSSAAFLRFDDWLTDSVEWAHARAGAQWPEAFPAAGVRAFVYRSPGNGAAEPLVVGALAPSRDQAGRLFPISVAASLVPGGDLTHSPQLLPLACEKIWQVAGACVVDLTSAEATEPASRLAELSGLESPNVPEAQAAYAGWSEALPLHELWALIHASDAAAGLSDALRVVIEAVRPLRNREAAATQLSLRFPLGAAGGAAVCFWLDVVKRLIGWRDTVPNFFWSHDGVSGQLTVHLGGLPPSTIAELWLPSTSRDEFCDLLAIAGGAALHSFPELPVALERAVRVGGSVADFLLALDSN